MKRAPILFATDYSPASRPAFERAVSFARERKAPLLIAHVLEAPIPLSSEGYVLPRIYDEMAVAIRSNAEKGMRGLLARARQRGVRAKGLLLNGPPHEAVARAARSHRASEIVMGTHGRTGFSRLFLGSVAARILATASCPVVVVPSRNRRTVRK